MGGRRGGLLVGGRCDGVGGRLHVARAHRADVGRRQIRRAGSSRRHAARAARRCHRHRQEADNHRHQGRRRGIVAELHRKTIALSE